MGETELVHLHGRIELVSGLFRLLQLLPDLARRDVGARGISHRESPVRVNAKMC